MIRISAFLVLALASAFAQPTAPVSQQLIRDVRVFDGKNVLQHRSVLIVGGKIRRIYDKPVQVPKAVVIDGSGKTLLPGLIDAHVHMTDQVEAGARQALVLGVTTQLDMFSAGDRLKRVKEIESADRTDLADIRTAGVGATVPGGHPTQMGGPPFPILGPADDVQSFVDARIAEGSDYIKIIHDDGSTWPWKHAAVNMLPNSTMRALIEAAHKRGKIAVVHVLSEQQARDAITAGADGLAHLFIGEMVSPDFARFVAAHHVFVVPTLTTLYLDCGKSQGPAILREPNLGPYIDQRWRGGMEMPKQDASANHLCKGTDAALRELVKEGVPILTGTDSPAPGATYGASVHGEMELLVADGMSPLQALAAATSVPAEKFGLRDRGQIKEGLRADLLLVDGDPTMNILDTRNIVAVWKRGVAVKRAPAHSDTSM
jgi:imidazolonepropionase-like amidohydrolase